MEPNGILAIALVILGCLCIRLHFHDRGQRFDLLKFLRKGRKPLAEIQERMRLGSEELTPILNEESSSGHIRRLFHGDCPFYEITSNGQRWYEFERVFNRD